MGPLTQLADRLGEDLIDWRNVRIADLLFSHRDTALLVLIILAGTSTAILALRSTLRRPPGLNQIALPAILGTIRKPPLSIVRYGALLFFIAGIPFFMLAFAAPYAQRAEQQVSYPGRRIALAIDASGSMNARFPSTRLNKKDNPNKAVFFTAVAAADIFIRERINGRYRDLIGLIEFGNEAYVITPFTNDYNNILLSVSLIGDNTEFMKFPDLGTTIGQAIEQSIGLFKAFKYLDAAGNLMILFSDGQDTQVTLKGKTVTNVLADAVQARIPVYFIRTSQNRQLGDIIPDGIWKPAVELTGGHFYAAANENDIIEAVHDIDRRSSGKIEVKQYSMHQPEFAPFATIAVSLWAISAALKVTVPYFSKFP